MSSYKSGFAALTEQKRSTYQMLLSLVHRVAQYIMIKRSNEHDIGNELLYRRLLRMPFFRIPRTYQIRPFYWGFSLEQNCFARLISTNRRH